MLSCQTKTKTSTDIRYTFSADSAYTYIAQQVAFGARVPGSDEHAACGDWLVKELARHGAQVKEQHGFMPNYAGEQQPIRNIVSYFEGTASHTILLCAHWDSRPWSDEEEHYDDRFTPVLGANDGASGVGVILEVLRQCAILKDKGEYVPNLQIVFFDCEDMGTPTHYTGKQREHTWCLGSQYWAQELKIQNSKFKIQNSKFNTAFSLIWSGIHLLLSLGSISLRCMQVGMSKRYGALLPSWDMHSISCSSPPITPLLTTITMSVPLRLSRAWISLITSRIQRRDLPSGGTHVKMICRI